VASKKDPLSRQERANQRAREWGFSNDYQFRKWKRGKGITGSLGHKNREKKILDALDNPKNFRAARKSGVMARALALGGWTYFDPKTKSRKPMDQQKLEEHIRNMQGRDKDVNAYWNLGALRTTGDYQKMLLLGGSDYTVGKKVQPEQKVRAIFYIMVMHNGMSVGQFAAKYADLLEAAGIDDLDDFVDEMQELYS
jgi:hypothetical protein